MATSLTLPPRPSEEPLDTNVAIEAPEQLRFRFVLAGPMQRGIAHLIDLLLLAAIVFGVFLLLVLLAIPVSSFIDSGQGASRALTGVVLVVLFAAEWLYFAAFEGIWHGQTPGKRWMSLRVVKVGGEPIGFIDAALRNLLRVVDAMPFVIPLVGTYAAGLTTMVVDRQFRRLGDLVAGTMVVLEDRLTVAQPLAIAPPTPAEERLLPARVVLDAEEMRTIELFLRRVPIIGAALAAELAAPVAEALGRKHGARVSDPIRMLALLHHRATAPRTFAIDGPKP